ncbi:MAG: SHOCT domain-containing protein [Chloroflexota bacterium]
MPMFGWSMGIEAWLFMAAWVVVIAVLVWFLVREPGRSSCDEAAQILRARLARGEITADEFARAIALLNTPPVNQEGSR